MLENQSCKYTGGIDIRLVAIGTKKSIGDIGIWSFLANFEFIFISL